MQLKSKMAKLNMALDKAMQENQSQRTSQLNGPTLRNSIVSNQDAAEV